MGGVPPAGSGVPLPGLPADDGAGELEPDEGRGGEALKRRMRSRQMRKFLTSSTLASVREWKRVEAERARKALEVRASAQPAAPPSTQSCWKIRCQMSYGRASWGLTMLGRGGRGGRGGL